jgi:hypothetical protein
VTPRNDTTAQDNDPTSEQEELEFDGTQTMQLDDTYRMHVVTVSENGPSGIERGQPQQKHNADSAPPADPFGKTSDYVDPSAAVLALEESEDSEATSELPKASDFNPHDAGGVPDPSRSKK